MHGPKSFSAKKKKKKKKEKEKKNEGPVGASIIIDDGKQQCGKESSLQLNTLAFSLI